MSMEIGVSGHAVCSWAMPGEEPAPAIDPLEEILAINQLITSSSEVEK